MTFRNKKTCVTCGDSDDYPYYPCDSCDGFICDSCHVRLKRGSKKFNEVRKK